jgi:hypothetical protein
MVGTRNANVGTHRAQTPLGSLKDNDEERDSLDAQAPKISHNPGNLSPFWAISEATPTLLVMFGSQVRHEPCSSLYITR